MSTLRQFVPGEVIAREGDVGDTAYLIERGRVEVTREHEGQPMLLASLTVGQVFGEMSLVDERPRSATVTALEDTVAYVIHRDTFLEDLRTTHRVVFILLRVLLERLRQANNLIVRLQAAGAQAPSTPAPPATSTDMPTEAVVLLEGLTPRARQVLPTNPFRIARFPFLIGRQGVTRALPNDLSIPDQQPLQISLHHLAFIQEGGRTGVVDQGSVLGSLLNGHRVGGTGGDPGPVFFVLPENTLILGREDSLYRFKVIIQHAG